MSAAAWIEHLQMEKHPEGGWFREIYRSSESIAKTALPDRFAGDRAFSTAIYFLLEGDDFSALHRICQDELFHFYAGSSMTIHQLSPSGEYAASQLGADVSRGELPVVVVPSGCVFGATVNHPQSYSLVGCTVAPGFDFADFVMPKCAELKTQFPDHEAIIERLTRQ